MRDAVTAQLEAERRAFASVQTAGLRDTGAVVGCSENWDPFIVGSAARYRHVGALHLRSDLADYRRSAELALGDFKRMQSGSLWRKYLGCYCYITALLQSVVLQVQSSALGALLQ